MIPTEGSKQVETMMVGFDGFHDVDWIQDNKWCGSKWEDWMKRTCQGCREATTKMLIGETNACMVR